MPDSGRNAYRGFEYQIRVTVWLSLTFFEHGGVETIVIEPLSGEDLHALDPASGIDTSERDARCRAGNVDVQVKGRQTDAWGNAELKEILQGGKDPTEATPRVWPLTRLRADESLRFLFVTDASVRAELRPLLVDSADFAMRSVPQGHLTAVLTEETDELRGRIGILDKRRLEDVEGQARDGLVRGFKVPRLNVDACFDRLVDRVRDGLREPSRGELALTELYELARSFGGQPEGPEPFVEPLLFATFRLYLAQRHALILLGEPGVGKTTAAERLTYEHRSQSEPFALLEPRAPDDLRAAQRTNEPVLVYVEDPFGRSRHEERSGSDWMVALEAFLAHVGTSRRLLVTSRESFAALHITDKRTPRAHGVKLSLDDEGYNRELLLQGHLTREPNITPAIVTWIDTRRALVLRELSRPLSYERLAARAAAVAEADQTPELLAKIVDEARDAEFGQELEETFAGEPEAVQRGLAAVWIALRTWPRSEKIDVQLARMEEALAEVGAEVRAAATRLQNLRWLKRVSGRLYMHPSYEDACLRVLERRPVLSSDVASRILLMLLNQADYDSSWAAWSAIAARLTIREATTTELRRAARAIIVASARRATPSGDFAAALRFLGTNPTDGEVIDMVAAALLLKRGRPRDSLHFSLFRAWKPPAWTPTVLAQVRANTEADAIVRAFVRTTFPTMPALLSKDGADQLVSFLYSIADVSLEFDAQLQSIDEVPVELATIIAEGAVASRNANADAMIRRAQAIDAAADAWIETLVDVDDDDYAYSEHLGEVYQERMVPARAMVDAVLRDRARNGARAWASTRSEHIVFEQFAERAKNEERELEVLRRVLEVCPDDLRTVVVAGVAQGDVSLRTVPRLASILLAYVPPADWASLIGKQILRGYAGDPSLAHLNEVAEAAANAARVHAPFERAALIYELGVPEMLPISARLKTVASDVERDAASALNSMPATLARTVLPLVEEIAGSQHSSAIRAIEVLAQIGLSAVRRLGDHVRNDADADRVIDCLQLADRLRLSAEEEAHAHLVLERGLSHKRASVREFAVELFGRQWDPPTLTRLARMVEDPSSRVRIALARALAGHPADAAWHTLVKLLYDSKDTSYAGRHGYSNDEDLEYGVARAAADALADLHVWEPDLEAAVNDFLASDASAARDAHIRKVLFAAREIGVN
jgi:hypothetical protein